MCLIFHVTVIYEVAPDAVASSNRGRSALKSAGNEVLMIKLLDIILDYVFPPRCMSCDEVLPIDYLNRLCADCFDLLERCDNDGSASHFSLYVYNDAVRHAIHRFKYGSRPGYGEYLGALMAEHAYDVLPRGLTADVVIPVPLHPDKVRERGFNQAEILAAQLCRRLGLTLETSALIRVGRTERQAMLSIADRRKNVENAFAVRRTDAVCGKTVLLVDDIHTTGSTINACASVLTEAGARSVFSYSLSNARLESDQYYDIDSPRLELPCKLTP